MQGALHQGVRVRMLRDGSRGVCVQAASPSLTPDSQQLDAHVLTSAAAEGLARNMQREDNLIFGLLHTFWEVGSRTSSLLSPPPLSIMLLACSNSSNRVLAHS